MRKEEIKKRITNAEEELKKAKEELANYNENKEFELYDKVAFRGKNYWIIEIDKQEDDTYYKLMQEDCLSKEEIEKYFTMPNSTCDNEVRFNDFGDNRWKNSYIRHILNSNYLKDNFDLEELRPIDGDYIVLPTKEEVENMPDEVRTNESWYWTLSPRSANSSVVFFVNTYGYVFYSGAYGACGVRQVVYLKSSKVLGELDSIESED